MGAGPGAAVEPAEVAERRGDAQVAREMVVAFPKELNANQQWELIWAYVRTEFVSKGMVADVAVHRNPGNPHAHIMLAMREMGPEGFSPAARRWFSQDARREFTQAQQSLGALDQAFRALGTTTEAELQAQRTHWQRQLTQLPGLEERGAGLGRLLELTVKALDGFSQEHEREVDWIVRRKRVHNRDSGRDR